MSHNFQTGTCTDALVHVPVYKNMKLSLSFLCIFVAYYYLACNLFDSFFLLLFEISVYFCNSYFCNFYCFILVFYFFELLSDFFHWYTTCQFVSYIRIYILMLQNSGFPSVYKGFRWVAYFFDVVFTTFLGTCTNASVHVPNVYCTMW